jgi:hypothetical protein
MYMNKLFPLPLYTFLKITSANGGVSFNKLKNITPWLIKTILFEPARWAELALYNQKISQHSITTDPVFILGFYRSGTSYLHQCFALDDRLGYHTNFQMVFPEVMLSTEKILLPVLESICRTFKIKDSVHRVPLSFRFPGEEDATMATYVDTRGAQWGYFYPGMMHHQFEKYVLFENVAAEELEAWKQSFIYLLKKISLANDGKQLVLKSPPNTARIKFLLSIFPNAKFVFIHRNPYDVYTSNKRFWGVVQKTYALKTAMTADINTIILDTYSKATSRYLQHKQLVPDGQLVEIAYDSFVQNPVENMQKIYESLHMDAFEYYREKLASFTNGQRDFKQLDHTLQPEERKMVNEKLEPFLKHWNYPVL